MKETDILIRPLSRYAGDATFTSALDPLADLLLHLEFLNARDYVIDLLCTAHRVAPDHAASRASAVRPHAQLAIQFARQAKDSPTDIAFVSCYYAILNLIKVYVLFTPLHDRLPDNRHHGASYGPRAPFTSLPDESIQVSSRGTIPLFYEAIVGAPVPSQVIQLGSVYPYIQDVSAEWAIAARTDLRIVFRHVLEAVPGGRRLRLIVEQEGGAGAPAISEIPAFRGFRPDPAASNQFISDQVHPESAKLQDVVYSGLDRKYLYHPLEGYSVTALMPGRLRVPEELPLILAFFHLSSVCRYHPERLEVLRASKYWPAVVALQSHGLHKFLILFWSHLRQATVTVSR